MPTRQLPAAAFAGADLENLLNALPIPVYYKDADLKYLWANRATCEFLGRREEDVLGRDDTDFFPPETARQLRTMDAGILASGQVGSIPDQRLPDSRGEPHFFTVNKTPIRDDRGVVVGLLGVSVDVTEHHSAEAERLTDMRRQRDALVREVHHRIKNHLQGVAGLLQRNMAAQPVLSVPLRGVLAQIESIAGIHGLQSRLGTQRLNPAQIVDMVARLAPEPVTLDNGPVVGCLREEDAVPFALTINELISNAFKHRERVTSDKVSVVVRQDGDGLWVRVENAPARLPEDFDFAAGRGLGTGLGLVKTLLPGTGSRLDYRREGGGVAAELWLASDKLLDDEDCPD